MSDIFYDMQALNCWRKCEVNDSILLKKSCLLAEKLAFYIVNEV